MPDRDENPADFGQGPRPPNNLRPYSEYVMERLENRFNQELRDARAQFDKNFTTLENRFDREMQSLRAQVEKNAAVPDRDLRELRAHVDRRDSEVQKCIEEEAKDIRKESDAKFTKIWNFGFWALTVVATPIVGYAVSLLFRNAK